MLTKISALDREIAARLRRWRKWADLSQPELAEIGGSTRDIIAACEAGKSALGWTLARTISERERLNLEFIFSGEGPMKLPFEPPKISQETQGKTRFSEVYPLVRDEYLRPLGREARQARKYSRIANAWKEMEPHIPGIQQLSEQEREDLIGLSIMISDGVDREHDAAGAMALVRQMEEAHEVQQDGGKNGPGANAFETLALHVRTDSVVSEAVNITVPDWKALRARLLGMLSRRGARADLAREIKVPSSRVSEWLGEKGKPNADQTIHLLRWIQQQEEQKTKRPGSRCSGSRG